MNQKAVAWVIEEKMSDKNTQSRTTMFSNLDDYVQHILERSFGITGNNPNGFVFQDPKGSGELVYTGIVCKAASDKLNPLPYYKVFAMSYERIRNMGCVIYEYQMTDAVSKFVRFNKYGYYHSVSSSTGSAPEPFQFDGTINLDYTDSNNSRGNLMLRSDHVSDDEKSQIITRSIHKAQKDFINHPVTKGAIFILTSVITAGMMQGVSAGSRMLFRNAFRKVLANSSELTAKTIGVKAVVSIGYQTIVEQKVNFVTVAADSILVPWFGEFVGNAFSLELVYNHNTKSLNWSSATILRKDLGAKEFAAYIIKSTIKAVLNQNIQADKILSQSKGDVAGFGYSIVLHKLTVEIDKVIQQ